MDSRSSSLSSDAGHLRWLGAWSADLHWGAHAPSRVVFGALAEDLFPSSLSPLTQYISGEGAGISTRGRVRSPPLAPRHRSQPSTLRNCREQALPVEGIRLAGIATTFADESGVLKLDVRLHRTKTREPVVLTREELMGLLDRLQGQHRMAAELQYGGGLRLSEVVRLRVKDIDPVREQITVRSGKGDRDRTTVLPKRVKPMLTAAPEEARETFATNECPSFHQISDLGFHQPQIHPRSARGLTVNFFRKRACRERARPP